MEYKNIIYQVKDHVGIITLNRPERLNAFTSDMYDEMSMAIKEIADDDNVRVLILTGAGRGFCSGADLKQMATKGKRTPADRAKSLREGPWAVSINLYNLEKPTISAVNGAAAGVGFSMAMACDIRIASDQARFSQAFIKRGLIPDTGSSYFLPRITSMAIACELVFTGKIIDSPEAQRIGLVSRVVSHDDLMKEVLELADEIAAGPPIAISLAKRALRRGVHSELAAATEYEKHLQSVCLETEDHKEGLNAFLEKRAPVFKGK